MDLTIVSKRQICFCNDLLGLYPYVSEKEKQILLQIYGQLGEKHFVIHKYKIMGF